ncbi:hypothetical protein [Flocculibacter collagenilyticus]|uniref:hypothetical protein n=1 Tax=Flocculibacter collagenilyticus TaxID=2744479 RepID=UPI0018F78C55|nr:hypothetical protein [Flocculibacter collagenilyticus]
MRLFTLLLFILVALPGCGGSSSNDAAEPVVEGSTLVNTHSLTLTILPKYIYQPVEVAITDINNGSEWLSSFTVNAEDAMSTHVINGLPSGNMIKVIFNPKNELIKLRCPYINGCFTESLSNNSLLPVDYDSPYQTRIKLSAIVHLDSDKALTVNVVNDLIAKVFTENKNELSPELKLKQAHTLVANTLGLIGYDGLAAKTVRNRWLSDAIDAGILFDDKVAKLNATSRLKNIGGLFNSQFFDNESVYQQLNSTLFQDALLYLQEVAITYPSIVEDSMKVELAKLRAFLSTKSIFPDKGYLSSPNSLSSPLDTAKSQLQDFRSLLYTFENDPVAYDQVSDSITQGYQLVETFSDSILTELFNVFSDVISEVPLGSSDGSYQVGQLEVQYIDSQLSWKVSGIYNQLEMDVSIKLERFSNDPITGTSLTAKINGNILSGDVATQLNNTNFNVQLNPAEDLFGTADGTGFIKILGHTEIADLQSKYAGEVNVRIDTLSLGSGSTFQVLESAYVNGDFSSNGQDHKLAFALVHPNIYAENSDTLLSNSLQIATTYSASVYGLGEPVLTFYANLDDIKEGLSTSKLDLIIYFEGRLLQLLFSGKPTKFSYSGLNQDGVSWNLNFARNNTNGEFLVNGIQVGEPRMLKNIAGILFIDGNFISVF